MLDTWPQADLTDYKVLFLDSALGQAALSLDLAEWFLDPMAEFANKGSLVEAFVGQELRAYAHPASKHDLFFWHRENRSSQAEVDYLIQKKSLVIPLKVKSGEGRTLKSLHIYLDTHLKSPYGIKFSIQNYSRHDKVHSYPIYAIAQVICSDQPELLQAINSL